MAEIISIIHRIAVTLFFLIYVIKTILLLSGRKDLLEKITKVVKVPEMIISLLFLATGIYLLVLMPKVSGLVWIKIIMVLASIPLAIIGFKKSNKILAALSLLLITASYGLAEVAKKKREKGEVMASGVIDGKEIYNASCVSCHGTDGKAGLSGAADLSKTVLDAENIKQVILNGKGTMMKLEMSPEQAAAVASFVDSSIKGK